MKVNLPLEYKINRLRITIESGYGLTGKPISEKRMKALKKQFVAMVRELNEGKEGEGCVQ